MIANGRTAPRIALVLSLLLGSLSFNACSSTTTPSASGSYRVVATTSVLADLARLALGELVGTTISVENIVPAGVDVHTFEPSPSDAVKVSTASIVVANGLGLDAWVSKLLDASGKGTGDVLLLGEGIDATDGWIYLDAADTSHGAGRDPHIWLDPKGAEIYVKKIAARVAADRADLAARIASSRESGLASLALLDSELASEFAAIPNERRRFVSFHDAFGYFARAYGIAIVGVAVEAPGQEPSAREIAALIEAIRAAKVKAIFSESQFPTRVAERIAAETGATVVAALFSDALGASPADTYLGAMRANAAALIGAMK